jgi:hypothetical protein
MDPPPEGKKDERVQAATPFEEQPECPLNHAFSGHNKSESSIFAAGKY